MNAVLGDPRPALSAATALDVLTDDMRAVLLVRAVAVPASGDPASVGATVRDIERLGRLRAAGALSYAEFEGLKAKLLHRP